MVPAEQLSRQLFDLAPFRQRNDAKAAWQLLVTLLPIGLLWACVPLLAQTPEWRWLMLPVLAALVLFSARTFSLMHDCGHNTLWSRTWLNRSTGFVLGCLNAIPQFPWSRGHAFHHKHNGNWERYRGPSALLTVDQYLALSASGQWRYGVSRHPLMLFPGGFVYLIVRPRLQLILGSAEFLGAALQQAISGRPVDLAGWRSFVRGFQSSHWYTAGEFIDLLFNNLVVVTSWWLMCRWLGAGLFWLSYGTVMTCSAAMFICVFFVQHNFDGSYASGSKNWNYFKGAIDGSSNLILPAWLNWFTADIAYHSVHHLCERIPNYQLRSCHQAHAHLLRHCMYLRLQDIPRCFNLVLWDSSALRLVSTRDARLAQAAA